MINKNTLLKIYHNDKMVCNKFMDKSYSQSALKPLLVLNKLSNKLNKQYYVIENFEPFIKDDFKLAHTSKYINYVFNFNKPSILLDSDIPWSEEFVTSLTYTNASLYNAIIGSINTPHQLHLSNTSGFHHSTPYIGKGFCTFSGQVIASTKIYRELGLVGCYLDLDAHYGNSIEDSRDYVKDLNKSIPEWANFNPEGFYDDYLCNFKNYLYNVLEEKIMNKKCDYIVYCHGADSILGDDLNDGKVTLQDWYKCTHIFYEWYNQLCDKLGKSFPLSLSLFGGYRANDYNYVIDAHVNDILIGLNDLKR